MKILTLVSSVCCLAANSAEFVTYESFGAIGDGKHDDAPAIVKAHQYANKHLLPVRAAHDRTYRIGSFPDAFPNRMRNILTN